MVHAREGHKGRSCIGVGIVAGHFPKRFFPIVLTLAKLLLTVVVLFPCFLFAQEVEKQSIIQSGQYYFGEGTSADEREATDAARAGLVQSISVTVSASFEHTVRETDSVLQTNARDIMRTYSLATLRNLQHIKTEQDGLRDSLLLH